jgi:predicted acyl esterase
VSTVFQCGPFGEEKYLNRYLISPSMLKNLVGFFLLFTQFFGVVSAALNVQFQENRILEVMVPMRDGVSLHTVIVFPRGTEDKSNRFTTIIDRSPYGYGDLEWFVDIFVPFGYVAIGQDMRGTGKSQGNFTMWSSDGNDSRDLGDWIVNQEWSNGQVMTFGASADGIGSLQTARTNPSWLSSQYLIWATSKAYQILFPFGAYKQETAEDWLLSLDMTNPEFVYTDIALVHFNERHTFFCKLSSSETFVVIFVAVFQGI